MKSFITVQNVLDLVCAEKGNTIKKLDQFNSKMWFRLQGRSILTQFIFPNTIVLVDDLEPPKLPGQ